MEIQLQKKVICEEFLHTIKLQDKKLKDADRQKCEL
jgi:hypothetical protein